MARQAGARREEGITLNARGVVRASQGDHAGGVADLEAALAIAEELDHPDDLAAAYVNLTHVLTLADRLDDAVRVGRAGIAELTRVGMARQDGSLVIANVAEALLATGRLDEADEVLTDALARHPRGVTAAPVLLQAGRLAMMRGDLTVAWERCEQARTTVQAGSAPDGWQRVVLEAAAEVELWLGRPSAAHDLVLDGLAMTDGTDEDRFAALLVCLGLRALADEAVLRRDAAARADLRGRYDDLVTRAHRMTPDPLAEPALPRQRAGADAERPEAADAAAVAATCRAEQARFLAGIGSAGEDGDGVAAWTTALDRWSTLGRAVDAAYATWRLAEARLSAGAGAPAVASVRAAHAEAVRIGLPRLAQETEALARWYRVDLVEPDAEPAPHELEALGLTAREQEVLAGLAAGRTNQEIADDAVHQREDRERARVEHPAQARRRRPPGGRPRRAPARRAALARRSQQQRRWPAGVRLRRRCGGS